MFEYTVQFDYRRTYHETCERLCVRKSRARIRTEDARIKISSANRYTTQPVVFPRRNLHLRHEYFFCVFKIQTQVSISLWLRFFLIWRCMQFMSHTFPGVAIDFLRSREAVLREMIIGCDSLNRSLRRIEASCMHERKSKQYLTESILCRDLFEWQREVLNCTTRITSERIRLQNISIFDAFWGILWGAEGTREFYAELFSRSTQPSTECNLPSIICIDWSSIASL